MRILLVEDEMLLCESLKRGLLENGMEVDAEWDGNEGLKLALTRLYDLIILDIMLPGIDGLSILARARESGVVTPVLFLTAKTGLNDKVIALNAGGDDYLTKPFAFSELMARIQALVRRAQRSSAGPIRVGDLELDPLARRVYRAGVEIELLPREYALLEYMVRNRNQSLTRAMIAESVWDREFDRYTNVIDVHINRLRTKLDRDSDVKLIQTIRGVGYMLKDPARGDLVGEASGVMRAIRPLGPSRSHNIIVEPLTVTDHVPAVPPEAAPPAPTVPDKSPP